MILHTPSLRLCSVVEHLPYKTEQNKMGLVVWWKQGYLKQLYSITLVPNLMFQTPGNSFTVLFQLHDYAGKSIIMKTVKRAVADRGWVSGERNSSSPGNI